MPRLELVSFAEVHLLLLLLFRARGIPFSLKMDRRRIRDWAGLPGELLHLVLDKLESHRDYVSFYQVCKPWLSIVREREEEEFLSLRPHLLFTVPYLDDFIPTWLLHSVFNFDTYHLELTSTQFKYACGCSHGWFAWIDPDNHLFLRDPFSARTIPLPPLQLESGSTVSKIVLSRSPGSAPLDCLVVAIYGKHDRLAFTKLGSGSWTCLDPSLKSFTDVMFDADRVFAVDKCAQLVSFDPQFGLPYVGADKVQVVVPNCMESASDVYIVRSCRSSAVLMVRWPGFGYEIQVFKLVEVDKRFLWLEVKSLEDEILFVGHRHSVSLSCLGILSALPNQVHLIRPRVGWCPLTPVLHHVLGEWPRKSGSSIRPPPKLQKLFCLSDNF
ncbi:hypothetical protein MLD38_019990 [Melastoma candidum]|uniref:Uncharacterized protein n=1 Tax=Melastoma candidum TaxID=119954 RepID=A0ACB9QBQ0_9MYRT|nr:hypothetical protein MLD38_019990 [Melastoma candidum]